MVLTNACGVRGSIVPTAMQNKIASVALFPLLLMQPRVRDMLPTVAIDSPLPPPFSFPSAARVYAEISIALCCGLNRVG